VVRWPYGQAARSLIHEDDIAAVAVKALTEDGHEEATYVLSGPATLTQVEQVRIIGDVLHRDLRWEELPPDAARTQLGAAFGDAAFADAALAAWATFVAHPEGVTSTVQQVTGHPACSFHRWVADHADEFRSGPSHVVCEALRLAVMLSSLEGVEAAHEQPVRGPLQ
jgi:hypothetical protein